MSYISIIPVQATNDVEVTPFAIPPPSAIAQTVDQQVNTNEEACLSQNQNGMSQSQIEGNDADAGQTSLRPQLQLQGQAQSQTSLPSRASFAQLQQSSASTFTQPALPTADDGICGKIGGRCSGDVTIYNDQGLGACGWQNDTNTQDFVALAYGIFGTYTNDVPGPHKNAMCGNNVALTVNGQQFSGMVTDRCGGCEGENIDLSQHLFSQLYPDESPGNGRYHNVPWSLSDQGPYHGPN